MASPMASSTAAGMALPQLIFWAGAIVPSFWGSHSTMAVYRKYSTFSSVEMASASSTGHFCHVREKAAWANCSLGIKPMNSGTPTMLRAPAVNSAPATTLRWPAPCRLGKSLWPPETSRSPEADRNSMGLVSAWEKMCRNAASSAACVPMPRPM